MLRRKHVRPDDRIPFTLSNGERDLLLDLVLVDPAIEVRLRLAATSGTELVVGLTLEDIDDLVGNAAAEANHSEDAKRRRALSKIVDRLIRMEREFTRKSERSLVVATRDPTKSSFTAKQGQYLAFIYYYVKMHGAAPAEADFQRYFRVTPPVVHQMILKLESKGFIDRTPREARSIRLRLSRAELPDLE